MAVPTDVDIRLNWMPVSFSRESIEVLYKSDKIDIDSVVDSHEVKMYRDIETVNIDEVDESENLLSGYFLLDDSFAETKHFDRVPVPIHSFSTRYLIKELVYSGITALSLMNVLEYRSSQSLVSAIASNCRHSTLLIPEIIPQYTE